MTRTAWVLAVGLLVLSQGCARGAKQEQRMDGYFDNTGREDVLGGGARMIEISTPQGKYRVWTKRVGNNPRIKLLLLHGGPGGTHEYFEAFDSHLPGAGIEYYYYDQLGSHRSDPVPDDVLPQLLSVERSVEEVEQVRQALGLTRENFFLLGHSWGGILAMEYALKYPQHLLRMPPEQWPDPVNRAFKHLNPKVYVPMQGPSELGASGKLLNWDRTADIKNITVPTLVIGAQHDTMDPKHMEWMAKQFPKGRFVLCPEGGHMAFYDDPEPYFKGLLAFLKDVEGKP